MIGVRARALVRDALEGVHERFLWNEIDLADVPAHVAIIQDGNRRYAQCRGEAAPEGYHAGADTTEEVLSWCADLGVEELTLYAFSTENFDRPENQLNTLFDLIESKLREFADAEKIHERHVRVRAIGDVDRLPARVRDAVAYAEDRTRDHDQFTLNVALAYGGRAELLEAARTVARDVAAGDLDPMDVDADEVERRLAGPTVRDVDLIVRTGGDERTSNFLPWHAAGNEAAVFFCAPYWPAFSKVDLLRGVRTYQAREESWRASRADRAAALVGAVGETSAVEAGAVVSRLRERLSGRAARAAEDALPEGEGATEPVGDGTG